MAVDFQRSKTKENLMKAFAEKVRQETATPLQQRWPGSIICMQ